VNSRCNRGFRRLHGVKKEKMDLPVNKIICGDCKTILQAVPDNLVDLVFCSPPYEDARTYGIDFKLTEQKWVDWAVERFIECVRVCKGVVCWVVEGKTRDFRWSATPVLLMADLHRAGIHLRKPPIYKRYGIPGSGGQEWLRNDYEFIVCASRGKLPWSDNTAMGHPPKYEMGGRCSNRTADGRRANEQRYAALDAMRLTPSETSRRNGAKGNGGYAKPKIANPGNIIDCGAAGGGRMGSKLASENEAPFPEALVEFFVRSFCPACGIVLDPFCGSGTTVSVAKQWGRNFIGIDIRQSQVDLSCMRIREIKEQYGLFESA